MGQRPHESRQPETGRRFLPAVRRFLEENKLLGGLFVGAATVVSVALQIIDKRDDPRGPGDTLVTGVETGALLTRLDTAMEWLASSNEQVVNNAITRLKRLGAEKRIQPEVTTRLVDFVRLDRPAPEGCPATGRSRPSINVHGALEILSSLRAQSLELKIDLARTDLGQANLAGHNLRGVDLSNACLDRVTFHGAVLDSAVLDSAVLDSAVFDSASMRGARLIGARASHSVFVRAVLRGADLEDAQLRNAEFRDADLRCAHLMNATLDGAGFSDADLTWANLGGTGLAGVRDWTEIRELRGAYLNAAQGLSPALRDESRDRGAFVDGMSTVTWMKKRNESGECSTTSTSGRAGGR